MRILHDYNFDELESLAGELHRDALKIDLVKKYVQSRGECFARGSNLDDAAMVLLEDVTELLCQHSSELDSMVGFIMNQHVPPEGEEPYDVCFYPKEKKTVFNAPRLCVRNGQAT